MCRIGLHIRHDTLRTMTCDNDHDNLMKKTEPLLFHKSGHGHGHSQWSWSNVTRQLIMHNNFEQLLNLLP